MSIEEQSMVWKSPAYKFINRPMMQTTCRDQVGCWRSCRGTLVAATRTYSINNPRTATWSPTSSEQKNSRKPGPRLVENLPKTWRWDSGYAKSVYTSLSFQPRTLTSNASMEKSTVRPCISLMHAQRLDTQTKVRLLYTDKL